MSRLVVVSGLPGTGKTTLARALVNQSKAAYLRVDVIETPLILAGVEVGGLGYEIVREVAQSNLALGVDVVVDLVNPLPVTRRMWPRLAGEVGARLVVFECQVVDESEHRRRVEGRATDLVGHVVPTWDEVVNRDYVPWDEHRDGPRVLVDMTDAAEGLACALSALAAEGATATDTSPR